MQWWLVLICAIAMVVGIAGVVVPFLPGLSLCLGAVLAWAVWAHVGQWRWLILGVCVLWFICGLIIKFAWPGKRMQRADIPPFSIIGGAALGLVGAFVIPIVGLPIGFVLGVWLLEAWRKGAFSPAWAATVEALKALALSTLVEVVCALAIAATWSVGVLLSLSE